ncbi:conserved hypothetical protein [Klebsiella variicola]|nr:conserved hypothetical protein [Klebsiella variicola]
MPLSLYGDKGLIASHLRGFFIRKGKAMKSLKIVSIGGRLVAIECDGLSCSSLPVSEFPIGSTALTLSQLMLEDAYAATS